MIRFISKMSSLLCFLLLLGVASMGTGQTAPTASLKWTYNLGQFSTGCSYSGTNCHHASPALANAVGDERLEIIVGTNAGYVLVLADNGNGGILLDSYDVAPALGRPPGSQVIASSPAAVDLDNNGRLDIIVGTGDTSDSCDTIQHGAMFVLEFYNGELHLKNGWPKLALDANNNGCRDSFLGAPAIGNLDGDSNLEIVAGSVDKRIYAWNHNGSLLPGFPPDSYHHLRFPTWGLQDQLADSIQSSPTIADLNGDGINEILVSTDEGMFDARYQGNMGEWTGWTCDYVLPSGWAPGYCGGALYGLSHTGQILPNFPRYYKETLHSSPAVGDVNEDGENEIFFGKDSFYGTYSPSHPTYGYYLHGLDSQGNELPGWQGGKNLGGYIRATPAIGDIAGDGKLEIIVPSMNGKIYAFHANGSPVNGFPVSINTTGTTFARSVILADYDADGKMEIFIGAIVIDGNGQQLTSTSSQGLLLNSPAIGNVDADAQLELVTQNTLVQVWNLPAGAHQSTWPMEYSTARRAGAVWLSAHLAANSQSVLLLADTSPQTNAAGNITVRNLGNKGMTWSTSQPGNVGVNPQQGQLDGGESINLAVQANPAPFGPGFHDLGQITVEADQVGDPVPGSPYDVTVRMFVGNLERVYLPYLEQ